MKMITKKIEKQIPKLYETDNSPIKDRVIYLHYMCLPKKFDWFVYEYDPETKTFYGFANLDDPEMAELGYFTLSEFEEINKIYKFNIIERDMHFDPAPTKEVMKEYPVLKKIINY